MCFFDFQKIYAQNSLSPNDIYIYRIQDNTLVPSEYINRDGANLEATKVNRASKHFIFVTDHVPPRIYVYMESEVSGQF